MHFTERGVTQKDCEMQQRKNVETYPRRVI